MRHNNAANQKSTKVHVHPCGIPVVGFRLGPVVPLLRLCVLLKVRLHVFLYDLSEGAVQSDDHISSGNSDSDLSDITVTIIPALLCLPTGVGRAKPLPGFQPTQPTSKGRNSFFKSDDSDPDEPRQRFRD